MLLSEIRQSEKSPYCKTTIKGHSCKYIVFLIAVFDIYFGLVIAACAMLRISPRDIMVLQKA